MGVLYRFVLRGGQHIGTTYTHGVTHLDMRSSRAFRCDFVVQGCGPSMQEPKSHSLKVLPWDVWGVAGVTPTPLAVCALNLLLMVVRAKRVRDRLHKVWR